MGNSASTRQQKDEESNVSVDGGSVLPQGLYPNATRDYDKRIVRKLIIDRKLAPFYTGRADSDDEAESSTSDIIAKPSADPITKLAEEETTEGRENNHATSAAAAASSTDTSKKGLSRTNTMGTLKQSGSKSSLHSHSSGAKKRSVSFGSVSHTHISRQVSAALEDRLPAVEWWKDDLWKRTVECPICFLYYPRNVNYTKCCEQPICTDCFVQIKRSESTMEPACCPYCVVPSFSITYLPPEVVFRRDSILSPSIPEEPTKTLSPISSSSSPTLQPLKSTDDNIMLSSSYPATSRTSSTSPTSPPAPLSKAASSSSNTTTTSTNSKPELERRKSRRTLYREASVVTSDDIRPDWQKKHQQLLLQRAANQRRALLQQLHTNSTSGNAASTTASTNQERTDLRAMTDLSGAASAIASFAERIGDPMAMMTNSGRRELGVGYVEAVRTMGADLEELMIMEAIRRSILEQEDAEQGTTTNNVSQQANDGVGDIQRRLQNVVLTNQDSRITSPTKSETTDDDNTPLATLADKKMARAIQKVEENGSGSGGNSESSGPGATDGNN